LAVSKERKVELVAQYVGQLKQSKGVILADYRGLTVSDISGLRNGLRSAGCTFWVVKNRLLKLALKEAGISLPDEWLVGPTIVGFCHDEVPRAAKMLTEAMRELEALRIKGGLVDASVVGAEQMRAIADLPPREVILAQALGTINAPASRMAGVIVGGVRQVLNVLQAYVEKVEKSGAAPGAEQAAVPA
jgi:large subunit ribosomal protein L10